MSETAKKKQKNKPSRPAKADAEQPKKSRTVKKTGFVGIVLLAGALLNVPKILKVPETSADKMMLAIVLALAAGGVILLLLGGTESSDR